MFEIAGWNGDAVRVAFAIDTHDREVLAWTASPRGIGGVAVRDLMLLAVERRFGTLAAPQAVEWLADNGSCFTEHETLAFAHAIGLVPCFTPVRSPESNGIAEAFVKTFKRDYVRLNARPDALGESWAWCRRADQRCPFVSRVRPRPRAPKPSRIGNR